MNYIYDNHDDEAWLHLHIQKYTLIGDGLMKAICGVSSNLNKVVNSNYPIDVIICEDCSKEYSKILKEK